MQGIKSLADRSACLKPAYAAMAANCAPFSRPLFGLKTRFVRYLHHLTEGGQFPCNPPKKKKKKKTVHLHAASDAAAQSAGVVAAAVVLWAIL